MYRDWNIKYALEHIYKSEEFVEPEEYVENTGTVRNGNSTVKEIIHHAEG